MRQLKVRLSSEGRAIEYTVDASTGSFRTEISKEDGAVEVTQEGNVGASDQERQAFSLKMYHIILAALRTQVNGET